MSTPKRSAPCRECPWRRKSIPGWVGPFTPEMWSQSAHGESLIWCHLKRGECIGAAIFRANVCKVTRLPTLSMPADPARVFSSSEEFIAHHRQFGFTSAEF